MPGPSWAGAPRIIREEESALASARHPGRLERIGQGLRTGPGRDRVYMTARRGTMLALSSSRSGRPSTPAQSPPAFPN